MTDTAIDNPVLVIGYGNPLRGDDGAGWAVATRLMNRTDRPHLRAIRVHQLLPELAETVSRMRHVVFIDASVTRPPGYIECQTITLAHERDVRSHHLRPDELLGLADHLYGRRPSAQLITVGGECFAHHDGLSAAVEQACERLVDYLVGLNQTSCCHA